MYSIPWQIKKLIPNKIVTNRCFINFWCSTNVVAFNIELCAIVIVTPEVSNNNVLSKGKPQISIGWIPFGGQIIPNEIDGDKLKWKKPQKKAKKNIISEMINKAIPYLNPVLTTFVWCPCPDSLITVINQLNKIIKKIQNEICITKVSTCITLLIMEGCQ